MNKTKMIAAVVALGLCCLSSLHAAEPARLPFYEANKGGVRFYVLGTLHVGKAGEPLRQEIAQALSRSSQLIMEVSAEEIPQVAALMSSRFCEDACLRRQVSAATFDRLSALFPGAEAGVERIPAWMMSPMLVTVDMSKLGLSPQWGTERRLMKIWGARPTRGLETPVEQVDALASFEDGIQREMLEGYLALSEEKRTALTQTLYQIWQSGDADTLYGWYQKMNDEEKLSSATMRKVDEVLIFSRNRRFIERLQPYLISGKPIFVAVGALHLGGDRGILALLRAQGFAVTAR